MSKTSEQFVRSFKETLKCIPQGYREAAISEMSEIVQSAMAQAWEEARNVSIKKCNDWDDGRYANNADLCADSIKALPNPYKD